MFKKKYTNQFRKKHLLQYKDIGLPKAEKMKETREIISKNAKPLCHE